jgi:hypothetical protein
MDRIRGFFRNPVTLLGTGFATFAAALFVAGLLTGGFSLAQEGTPTTTQGTTATATNGEARPEADATPDGEETDKETRRDTYLDTLAENLGVTREALDAALKQTGLDMVDQALADGKITEEEAANIRERIESGEGFLFPFGPGFGHHGHPGFKFGFHFGVQLDDLAEFLGVDNAVVTDALRNGDTLAEIAEANGKTRDELKAHLMEDVSARVAEAVENGDMTQEEADEKLADATERIDDLIDRGGFPGPHLGPWGPGMREDIANEGTMFSPGDF